MVYLVDTDVLIDVAKGHPAAVDYVNGLQAPWSVSAITAMELLVGARDQRDVEKIDELLTTFPTVPSSVTNSSTPNIKGASSLKQKPPMMNRAVSAMPGS